MYTIEGLGKIPVLREQVYFPRFSLGKQICSRETRILISSMIYFICIISSFLFNKILIIYLLLYKLPQNAKINSYDEIKKIDKETIFLHFKHLQTVSKTPFNIDVGSKSSHESPLQKQGFKQHLLEYIQFQMSLKEQSIQIQKVNN